MVKKQVKSKKRVSEVGEVFTAEREVKAMCDLVSQECDRIESRFLEPACGDGNFLVEVLNRKLSTVKKKYKRNSYDFERFSILAISSIYGVDIMKDNVIDCIDRLYKIWEKDYKSICKKDCNDETKEAVKYILSKNILCGNALTLMRVYDDCKDTDQPIIFPQWSIVTGALFKRLDFRLDVLLKVNEQPSKTKQKSIFDEDEINECLEIHPATGEYIPLPIKEYTPIHYKKIAELDNL